MNQKGSSPASEQESYTALSGIQTQIKILQSESTVERTAAKLKVTGLADLKMESGRVTAWREALVWIAGRAFRHKVTLGDLAMFYQAFQQGLRLSRSLLDDAGQLCVNALFPGDLFDFLALEPKVLNPAPAKSLPALRQAIRFRGVSFRYPGVSWLAVRDLDLEIPAGCITAVVGLNGAGKSTLIKLLCRL